jgi:hypothetical protein
LQCQTGPKKERPIPLKGIGRLLAGFYQLVLLIRSTILTRSLIHANGPIVRPRWRLKYDRAVVSRRLIAGLFLLLLALLLAAIISRKQLFEGFTKPGPVFEFQLMVDFALQQFVNVNIPGLRILVVAWSTAPVAGLIANQTSKSISKSFSILTCFCVIDQILQVFVDIYFSTDDG